MPATLSIPSLKRVAVLKALAHPSRLLITEALMHGERCVAELRDLVGDDVSTVSKHLSLLRAAGVLVSENAGSTCITGLAATVLVTFYAASTKWAPAKESAPDRSQPSRRLNLQTAANL